MAEYQSDLNEDDENRNTRKNRSRKRISSSSSESSASMTGVPSPPRHLLRDNVVQKEPAVPARCSPPRLSRGNMNKDNRGKYNVS